MHTLNLAALAPATCLLIAVCVLYSWRRRRWVYALFAAVVVLSMVASPLLQSGGLVLFRQRLAHAAENTPSLAEALGIDDHTPPQSALAKSNGEWPDPEVLASILDTDASAETDQGPKCGDGSIYEDTDGDGLKDAQEYCLGTDPFDSDSDGDSLSDGAEVNGFNLSGKPWTTDPLRKDSNSDGQSDFSEWKYSASAMPGARGLAKSFDFDADETPNVWDDDDDNDGVPDRVGPVADGCRGGIRHQVRSHHRSRGWIQRLRVHRV